MSMFLYAIEVWACDKYIKRVDTFCRRYTTNVISINDLQIKGIHLCAKNYIQ